MGDDVVEEQGAQEEGTNPGKSQQEVKVYCKDCDKSFPSKHGLALHLARWCSAIKRTKESVETQEEFPIENDDVDAAESVSPLVAVEGAVQNIDTGGQNKDLDLGEETNAGKNDDVDAADSVSPLVAAEGAVQNTDTGGQNEDLDQEEETNAGENDDVDAAESVSPLVAAEGAVQNTTNTGEQNEGLDQGEETNTGKNDCVDAAESVSPLVAVEGAVQNTTDTDTGKQNEDLDQGEETNADKSDKETKLDCKDCDKSFSSKSGLALHSARWCPAIKRMKESIEGQKDFPIENDGVEEQNQDQDQEKEEETNASKLQKETELNCSKRTEELVGSHRKTTTPLLSNIPKELQSHNNSPPQKMIRVPLAEATKGLVECEFCG